MTTIRDSSDEQRYEIHEDGRLAGYSDYKLTEDTIALAHTEIDRAFSGRGFGRELVTEALIDARRRGLSVLPFCPYVREVIAANPAEYLDLVRPQDRTRFKLPEATP